MSYSIITRTNHKGEPYIEILRNQAPWGKDSFGSEHFCFQERKARMILAALPAVRAFLDSNGRKKPAMDHVFMEWPYRGEIMHISYHDAFERNEITIELPYLTLFMNSSSISFGVAKAEALVALEETLSKWVASL